VAYGHIAIGVDDLDGTLATLKDEHGIEPERPPYQVREGGSRICFVSDPWIAADQRSLSY
jgi:lactoylglutathione lyase